MRGRKIAALTIAFLMIICQIPSSVISSFAFETGSGIYISKDDNTDSDKFIDNTDSDKFVDNTDSDTTDNNTDSGKSTDNTDSVNLDDTTDSDTANQIIELTLPDGFEKSIVVKTKTYNGKTKAEVDLSGVSFNEQISDDILLKANADFEDMNVGKNKTVTVYDIHITGENSDKYELKLKEEQKIVVLNEAGEIKPRKIHLYPEGSIVRGEHVPKEVNYEWEFGDVIDGDDVDITTKVFIDKNADGNYYYKIEDKYATGNPNYYLIIKSDIQPDVYDPKAPVITEAKVVKEGAKHLNQNEAGIFADGDVAIFVKAKTQEQIDVEFTLTYGDTVDNVKVSENRETTNNNIKSYIYIAKFVVHLPENKKVLKIDEFSCVATNGTESEKTVLNLKTDSNKTVKNLIIDTVPSYVNSMVISYDNEIRLFYPEGEICDDDSGIKSIKYKWDSQTDWIDYDINKTTDTDNANTDDENIDDDDTDDENKDTVKNTVHFLLEHLSFHDSSLDVFAGLHTLHLMIEDNAGNIYTEKGEYCDSKEGPDIRPPEVYYINMSAKKSALHTILNILTFGNYTKEELVISVKAYDKSYSKNVSGIANIALLGNKKDNTDIDDPDSEIADDSDNNTDSEDTDRIIGMYEYVKEYKGLDDTKHTYVFKLNDEQSIDGLTIYLKDNYNNYELYPLSQLLKGDEAADIDSEVDRQSINTDMWVMDFTEPKITFDYSNAVCSNKQYYFDNTGRNKIIVIASDDNAVRQVKITEQYFPDDKKEPIKEEILNKEYDTNLKENYNNKEYFYEISDYLSKESGWYSYVVTVYDFANNETKLESDRIYIDHSRPKGDIKIESMDTVSIDTAEGEHQIWVRDKDDKGNYNDITLRLYALADGADIMSLRAIIKGEPDGKNFDDTFENFSIDEEGRQYVDVVISNNKLSDNYIPLSSEHTYSVQTTVNSVSGNSIDTNFTFYVDTENPIIHKFTVEKKNSAAETILNVLTFGVFANDSLRLKVEVKDAEKDIGISRVEIMYDGLDEPELMMSPDQPAEDNEYEVYYYDLELGTQVFQSNIVVTAYDKIGKKNNSGVNINNTEDEHGEVQNNFVMIEDIAPVMTADLPQADYIEKKNGKIWYRAHPETDDTAILEFSVQDENSGIREVKMFINDSDVSSVVSRAELDEQSLPTIESTLETGIADRTKLCEVFTFRYSIDLLSEIVEANKDGSYIIQFKTVDNAGNVTTSPSDENGDPYEDDKIIIFRDVLNPVVSGFTLEPESYDGISSITEYIEELEYGYYFKDNFILHIKAEDPEPSSGLKYAELRLEQYNKGKKSKVETYDLPMSEGENSIEITKGFKGRIFGVVFDNVKNSSDEVSPQAYVIDDDKPKVEVELVPKNSSHEDNSGNMLYTGDVDIKVTITDEKSGLRSITHSKQSENGSTGNVITEIDNTAGYDSGAVINGWEIAETDANLVTKMTRVFRFGGTNSSGEFDFSGDDNSIQMQFSAMDRSGNESDIVSSPLFSIDTIAPIMSVNYSEPINNMYYNSDVKFTVTITEKNFKWDSCFKNTVTNAYTDAYPSIEFTDNGLVHTAEFYFVEGDYSFSIDAEDLGGHRAVTEDGSSASFRNVFNVDKTKPQITTNFAEFGKDENTEIYYNFDTDVVITVVEHNFDPQDMDVVVKEKMAGSRHINEDDEEAREVWYDKTYFEWKTDSRNSDTHILTIPLSEDGVYKAQLKMPKDRATNAGEFEDSLDHTAIFEIDKTAPELSNQNGISNTDKNFVSDNYYDVYDETRKNELPPSVEFTDINFDRIEVEYLIYTPTYTKKDGKEINRIEPTQNVYGDSKEIVTETKYSLPEDLFKKDGVYIYKFVALDKAGNPSKVIENTYFKMINTDVLAYIENSSITAQSGYYSLMHEDGTSISKKSTNFSDLSVCVIKLDNDDDKGTLAVRRDEVNYYPEEYAGYVESPDTLSKTSELVRMSLPRDYFAETFKDDQMDARMYLSVSVRDSVYLDLAQIHIDNVPPSATLPREFRSWHNIFTRGGATLTLTDISETLDNKKSGVYECPGNGLRGEKIAYEYEPTDGTFSFDLKNGMHHIEVSLVDEAGNEWNVERVKYLTVGNYLIYIILGIVAVIGGVAGFTIFRKKRS